jgi:hypothetical protein
VLRIDHELRADGNADPRFCNIIGRGTTPRKPVMSPFFVATREGSELSRHGFFSKISSKHAASFCGVRVALVPNTRP